jgi:hypothetical protein
MNSSHIIFGLNSESTGTVVEMTTDRIIMGAKEAKTSLEREGTTVGNTTY